MEPAVREYLGGISSPKRRRDAETMVELMRRATGEEPQMSGSIVGFGRYHYKYATGREGDTAAAGFAARKAVTTVYVQPLLLAGGRLPRLPRVLRPTGLHRAALDQADRGHCRVGLDIEPATLVASDEGLDACGLASFRSVCQRVRAPVLVIHGDGDELALHARGEALAAVTGGELVTVAGGGHFLQAREPVLVNRLIKRFVDRIGR